MSVSQHNPLAVRLAYGSFAFFITSINNIFIIYYVDVFISVYKIDQTSFWIGEAIFLVWNSLNDPLFGWLSDRKLLLSPGCSGGTGNEGGASPEIVLKRVKILRNYGPLFALSFMSLWIRWTWPGLQFVISLCLYDGFLTILDLNFNALLADLAVSVSSRSYLNKYCSIFSCFGTTTVFLSYAVWNRNNLVNFQIFCAVMAAIAACGFLICATILRREYCKMNAYYGETIESRNINDIDAGTKQDQVEINEKIGARRFLLQVFTNKNFIAFSMMNLLQVFHCHFNSNFFPMFLHYLLGTYVSPSTASLLLGLSFVMPHLNNIYLLWLCRYYGVYAIIQGLFYGKLILGLIMLSFGPQWLLLLCIFIVSNRIFTEGTCKLLNLAISDLVDQDYVIFSRKQPISALIFGVTAFVSKPGQTIAPLMGSWMIESVTGNSLFKSDYRRLGAIAKGKTENLNEFRQGCFHVLVGISIVCAVLQIITWSFYDLRNEKLKRIKEARRNRKIQETNVI